MTQPDRRDQFLIAMYEQLMNDINRHIMVVWQSIATLVAAVAVFSFVKDNILPMDVAIAIILIICSWLIGHVYDAGYWYNRNLVIISNIERQFLVVEDLKNIHYYFGVHRPDARLISHLKLQRTLAITVSAIFLLFHFYSVIWVKISAFQVPACINSLPWLVAVFGCYQWHRASVDNKRKYKEFLDNSPGIAIDTSTVTYGIGHGHS